MTPTETSFSPWQTLVPRPSREFPRKYLKNGLTLSLWSDLSKVVDELLSRQLPDGAALLKWIDDYSEFGNAVSEEGSRLYIEMTCNTQDKGKEKAYLNFVENIQPKLAEADNALNQKIYRHPASAQLPPETFGRWLTSIKTEIELFREENIPLKTDLAKLSQEYQKICGAMTVEWDGQVKTLSQLAPFLQENDRPLRERAWRAVAERRLKDREAIDGVFDKLFKLRLKVAANVKMDFVAYTFKKNERDYAPADCFKYHEAVEKAVVPYNRKILERRRERLGLSTLRPWDLSCDVLGRPPLKPFKTAEELTAGVGRIFKRIDPELSGYFETLRRHQLLDLDNRVGKAPGGYQSNLEEVRLPFIFMNAVGLNGDVFTLLHESGHAFHSFLTRQLSLAYNRSAPMEFCEVASMGMERIASRYLDEFYGEEGAARAVSMEYEEILWILPWVAVVDAFQHWLYTHPGHTGEERNNTWLSLNERFFPGVDWSGLNDFHRSAWHRQLHIFEYPFYYIEYGIAQLGALQLWAKAQADEKSALDGYKKALKLGGTLGVKTLFEKAGLHFDLSEKTIAPLAAKAFAAWEAAQRTLDAKSR